VCPKLPLDALDCLPVSQQNLKPSILNLQFTLLYLTSSIFNLNTRNLNNHVPHTLLVSIAALANVAQSLLCLHSLHYHEWALSWLALRNLDLMISRRCGRRKVKDYAESSYVLRFSVYQWLGTFSGPKPCLLCANND